MKTERSKTPPVSRNDDITLTIDALGSDGQGIGRLDGYTVFVPGALPGETVCAHVIKPTTGYAVAKLLAVETASPQRQAPVCPQFERCGGCTLQHYGYQQQLQYKRSVVENALRRIGGFAEPNVLPVIGMETPWRYRNKGSFPFAYIDGHVEMGFYAPRSHRLVPLRDCAIQDERVLHAAAAVRDWADAYAVQPYDEATGKGILRHVVVRVSTLGEVMAVVVTTGRLPQPQALVDCITAAVPEVAGILHNVNDQRANIIMGSRFTTLYGSDRITEQLCGSSYEVSAGSFLQVNPVQTQRLYQAVLEYAGLTGEEFVVDAYCGIGTISLMLSRHAKRVLGIESFAQAVEDAKQNALHNGVENVEFICAPAEQALPRCTAEGMRPEVLVADPPRKGCERPFLDAVIACGVKRMVYVSCDPGTLARDCGILREGGFSLERVQPVDMFPQTTNVECVALLKI